MTNFGELVLARSIQALDQGKHQERFVEGWWLGRAEGTNEHIVAVKETGHVMRFRAVKRYSDDYQFGDQILRIKSVPWKRAISLGTQLSQGDQGEEPQQEPLAPPPGLIVPPVAQGGSGAAQQPAAPEPGARDSEASGSGEQRVPAAPAQEPGERVGFASMSSQKRRMREELGLTPHCDACDHELGTWEEAHRCVQTTQR